MSSMREEPLFNLKAVVQQTGLKPDTLRAWERRYGLPQPRRSEGGHRLYSQRDIDTVRWLVARQREGLTISRAVELWEQLEASGRDPLLTQLPLGTPRPEPPPGPTGGETLAELRASWKSACLAYDDGRAEQVLAQAFALYPAEMVAVEVLQKALAQVGEGWSRGEVTVQQEHFCSELAMRRVEALLMAAPAPTRPTRILVACPPDEQHVLGPLILTLLLRRQGWSVIDLGANVPLEHLEATLTATQPDLAIVAAQRLHTAATLREMARLLHQHEVTVAYGGGIFNREPGLRAYIPGHFLGQRLDLAPQQVESLMVWPRPLPEVKPVPQIHQVALAHFQERSGLIESELLRTLQGEDFPLGQLSPAHRELAAGIEAALAFGDLDYLGTDLEAIGGLLHSLEISGQALQVFLEGYRCAAAAHLDERGRPILAWLSSIAGGK